MAGELLPPFATMETRALPITDNSEIFITQELAHYLYKIRHLSTFI